MKKSLLSLMTLAAFSATAAEFILKVDYAPDGDTIRAFDQDGNSVKVRMLGVDTPEKEFKGQSQGEHALAATNFLRQLLPTGTEIRVVTGEQETEKWDRILGIVYLGDININTEILRQGYGMPYFIYPFENDMIQEHRLACEEAERNGRGVFSKANPLQYEPYVFRMRASGYAGNNLVGNMVTKEFFAPAQYKQIPICSRVFFYQDRNAETYGYHAAR